jgi:hypothetical protein
MQYLINRPDFSLQRFAETLERNAQEAVKWERRKLEWMMEERKGKIDAERESD